MSTSSVQLYEASIKCKYCSHFYAPHSMCCLYDSYDSSLPGEPGSYLKKTSPDNHCDKFSLPTLYVIPYESLKAEGKPFHIRQDGTLVITLDDLHNVHRVTAEEIRKKGSAEILQNQNSTNSEPLGCVASVAVILGIILFIWISILY